MTNMPRHRVRRSRRQAEPATAGVPASAVVSDAMRLIGRERELEAIRAQLLPGSGRLVTLTGAGGIGKTQLALAAARDVQPAFPHGVWFVDLAPLRDPGEIDSAIASALRLETVGGPSPAEQVTRYLQNRRLLLILDNFEHLLPAAGRVSEMLADAPGLTVLVTSREPLNLRLEQRLSLRGLGLPDLRVADPESIAQAPAAALFLEHARRLQPDLALTPADARALAELLHRLDGIPLAIRIAAAHSTVLSPAAMLSRLAGQGLLSVEGTRDVPVRHHTLHDAIEWSYALLSTAEQAAFLHLAIFVGGWTLEAAEAVIPKHEPAPPAWRILGLLVDKSLVQTESFREGLRYRMLEPIREYAVDRLRQSAELDAARDQHARYFATLADQLEAASFGPQEPALCRQAAAEHENFRAAVRWAIERRDGELSLRLAGSLMPFWVWRGSLREGQRFLEEARTVGSEAPPLLRAKALGGEGGLAWLLGEYPKARILLQEALALAEAIHDPVLTGRVLWRLGFVLAFQGDVSEARALLERSAPLGREAEDPRDTAYALVALGVCFVLLEDLERAEAAFNGGLDLARQYGGPRVIVFALTGLAHLKLRREDYAGAAPMASEALEVARAWESRRGIKAAVVIAALVAGHRGDVERAVRLLAAVDPWGDLGQVVPLHHDATAVAMFHGRARQQMGEGAYRTAVVEAQTMSVEQVADLARLCLEPARARGRVGIAASASSPRSPLSERERAVLHLIGEGLPNKQIATALSIAERTVKKHVSSAMDKLGVDNRAHAVVAAIQRGLL